MRDYRIQYQGEVIQFSIWVQAINEYEAKQEAKRMHPHFAVIDVTEVMPYASA